MTHRTTPSIERRDLSAQLGLVWLAFVVLAGGAFLSCSGSSTRETHTTGPAMRPPVETTTVEATTGEPPTRAPSSGPRAQTTTADPGTPLPPTSLVHTMWMSLVLDHPRVAPYLHLEDATNRPVTVYAVSSIADGLGALRVRNEPVRAITTASDPAMVRFTNATESGARVVIDFAITSEGVQGQATLTLRDNVWACVDLGLVER